MTSRCKTCQVISGSNSFGEIKRIKNKTVSSQTAALNRRPGWERIRQSPRGTEPLRVLLLTSMFCCSPLQIARFPRNNLLVKANKTELIVD